jgi:multiple sugar transport system ATP-binding protein
MYATPGIGAYLGRDVILGIRPSDFEDAGLTGESWPVMAVEATRPSRSAARST